MNRTQKITVGVSAFFMLLTHAYAQTTLSVSGSGVTPTSLVSNIKALLIGSVQAVSIAIFTIGALLYVMAGDKEDGKTRGKDFMVGALVGLALVYFAPGLLNIVLFFIYG